MREETNAPLTTPEPLEPRVCLCVQFVLPPLFVYLRSNRRRRRLLRVSRRRRRVWLLLCL